jgi:ATP-dependent RNA helicase DeaD
MSFATLPALLRIALASRGHAEPTAIPAAIPQPEAAERDLPVSAETGSGKTVAYGLALAPELLGNAQRLPPAGAPTASAPAARPG